MSSRFQWPSGGGTLSFREKSNSTKENTQDNYILASLNALDDDIDRLEFLLGVDADDEVSDIDYTSNLQISDATSFLTAISRLDQELSKFYELGYRVATISSINTGTEEVTTSAAHGLSTGDIARIGVPNASTIPTGLNKTKQYYVRAVSTTVLKFYATSADASGDTNVINITDSGSGTLYVIGDPPSSVKVEGSVWVNETPKVQYRGSERSLVMNHLVLNVLDNFKVVYTDAETITVTCNAFDSTGKYTLNASSIAVDVSASGAGGLDTGSEAADTWYFLYLIGKSTDLTVSAILSTTNEVATGNITLPSGYDLKRQLPFAVRNNTSSDFIPFNQSGFNSREFVYNVAVGNNGGAGTPTNILNAGTDTSFADISNTSKFVPPISQLATFALLQTYSSGSGGDMYTRPKGETHNGFPLRVAPGVPTDKAVVKLATDSNQLIQYQVIVNTIGYAWVLAFTVTEL